MNVDQFRKPMDFADFWRLETIIPPWYDGDSASKWRGRVEPWFSILDPLIFAPDGISGQLPSHVAFFKGSLPMGALSHELWGATKWKKHQHSQKGSYHK